MDWFIIEEKYKAANTYNKGKLFVTVFAFVIASMTVLNLLSNSL